jgi:triacylglycerol esterase/lipase EstA (alpha/beta hydrolase family)
MTLPTVILPGYLARASDYQELATTLESKGIPSKIVPLRKRDWLPTIGGRSVVPILRQIDATVRETLEDYKTSKINLIGHSAGGWLARIYLGEKPYDIHGDVSALWNGREKVEQLISLGTPHISQERWTRKNLDFVKNNYPGAFYADVKYVCLAGKAVYGENKRGSWLAYNSYKLTCGEGNAWGDGITPIAAAHLEGAVNLVLDGVFHAPTSPGKWYGSPEVVEEWIGYLND